MSLGRRLMSTARAIAFTEHGDPARVLGLVKYDASVCQGPVNVRFLAAPINPADLNQIEGVYPSKPRFDKSLGKSDVMAVGGNEGVVEVLEAAAGSGFAKGDWAVMSQPSFGTWRTHAAAQPTDLVKIPRTISAQQAATLSINPSTAYRMLSDKTDLAKGDWVIQNAANSAVGTAAIQIARIRGLHSINIIRNRPDAAALKSELQGLGADLVLTDEELADRKACKETIASATQGAPIKLGLNATCGKIASEMCRHIATNGHVVTYGAMSKQPLTLPAGLLIFKNITFSGFWVSQWNKTHPDEQGQMLKEIIGWIEQGKFKTANVETLDFADDDIVARAFGKDAGFSTKSVFVM